MSDVWQGPGWWLASDGKWYPADAGPEGGDGDESTPDDGAPGSAETEAELAAESATVATVEPPPDPHVGNGDAIAEPSFVAPEVEPFEVAADEPASGGWQAIVSDEPAAPEPAATDVAVDEGELEPAEDDDGWTSAFEERASAEGRVADVGVSDMPPPAPPSPPGFEPVAPTPPVTDPDFAIPPVSDPDFPVPPVVDEAAPTPPVIEPDVEMPPAPIPEVGDAELTVAEPEVVEPEFPEPGVVDEESVEEASTVDVDATDVPEVPQPQTVLIDAGPDVAELPTTGEAGLTETTVPRAGAWRSPGETTRSPRDDEAEQNGPIPGAPDVVDLAIPSESPLHDEVLPSARRNRGILALVAVLAVVVGLAFLINWFLSGDDSSDVTADDTAATAPPTTSSAPSTSAADEAADDTAESSTTIAEETTNPPTTEDPLAGEEVSVFELRAGDCIEGEIGTGEVQQLLRVDCSLPHEYEVFREALIDSSITEYDAKAISDQAQELCSSTFDSYVSEDDDRDLKFQWLQPTEESWTQPDEPDRVITCLLYDEAGPLTGRVAT